MKRRPKKIPRPDGSIQTLLPLRDLHWPDQRRYPLNHHEVPKQYAAEILDGDIRNSTVTLIVTGFTSLAYIIDTFGYELDDGKRIQIVLGFEPEIYRRKKWKQAQIEQEIADYWLERGISPAKCGAVITTIERIKSGQLQFKVLKTLHAKIYVTDYYAMLGSSNFSRNGLKNQHEANIRVECDARLQNEHAYNDMKAIADNFWLMADSYNEGMISLLEELVIVVGWQEALARAIAAVLEGNYLKEYKLLQEKAGSLRLWPIQWQGIAQAMQILQEKGSVLIADPTGSGKTKMVTTLQLAIVHWLFAIGHMDKTNAAVVAPPAVLRAWHAEQLLLERNLHEPVSQGVLSNKQSQLHVSATKVLQIANLLVMDEAHNYLRRSSNRSLILSSHNAEFIILATATPINKQAKDLIRLIELLDPDNLRDEELIEYKILYRKRFHELAKDISDLERLRKFIWKFTIRRTKTQINEEIKKEQWRYRNALGKECRYPKPEHKSYKTEESPADKELAEKIVKEAEKLKGIIYLRALQRPKHIKLDTIEAEISYLEGRTAAAEGLSKYRVTAALRSSRVALLEVIEGTSAAISFLGSNRLFDRITKQDGNILADLNKIKAILPVLPFPKNALPSWLRDRDSYKRACEEEIASYKEISRLTRLMSDARERGKANFLASLLKSHNLIVAFDHTVISLHHFQALLTEQGTEVYIGAGGENKAGRETIQKLFALSSSAKGIIALCSDAMSEGINLQAADVVVMLDMPSILRLAEQRIGRIDRLDSPHTRIISYWPEDSVAFALRTDWNLYRTAELTRQMLRPNITLPNEFMERFAHEQKLKLKDVFADLTQRQGQEVERMRDGFEEVRNLKEGKDALISEDEYLPLAHSRASVKCKVSYVASHSNWAFFAMAGSKSEAPRWYFLDEAGNSAYEYDDVCRSLRTHLIEIEATAHSESDHQYFLQLLRKKERQMLPNKRRRALEVAERLLSRQLAVVKAKKNVNLEKLISDLLRAFNYSEDDEVSIDWYQFAGLWLDVLRPVLKSLREQPSKRNRDFISLSDLEHGNRVPSFTDHALRSILDNIPVVKPIEYRIAASIVGIKKQ